VSYFKPFKTTFRKVKDVAMFRTDHMDPNNITMVGWVDYAIDQSLIDKNMKYGFKTTCIWPFNLKAMNNKPQLLEFYTITSINNIIISSNYWTLL
jgi:hypothetical protein